MNDIAILIKYVDNQLLSNLDIVSVSPYDPIVVKRVPKPWILLGVGNYAAVVTHPDFSQYAVKIYAEGRNGIEEEVKVYSKIKKHPSFSQCYYYTENYLILKRIEGKTLYACINEGIQISEKIINDIEEALKYAKSLGLNPHDVHVKNVMKVEDRGVVVDISDFTKSKECLLWEDLKKVYYKFYIPFLYKTHPAIPEFYLNAIRRAYRFYRNKLMKLF